jgi:hypothetical protein
LRSFWACPAADTQGRNAAAATAAHAGRPFSAASGLVRQSAAAEPAAAEQQQQEEETLEQIQSRIFGNHIGKRAITPELRAPTGLLLLRAAQPQ